MASLTNSTAWLTGTACQAALWHDMHGVAWGKAIHHPTAGPALPPIWEWEEADEGWIVAQRGPENCTPAFSPQPV